MEPFLVRSAVVSDVSGMARVHVQSSQEAYRGLLPDAMLDDPELLDRRRQWWRRVLTEGADGTTDVAVALQAGAIVGLASAGAPRDADARWPVELFVIYTLARIHGQGVGERLLDAVIGTSAAALWVADPNPRAVRFYQKHGFAADGATKTERIPEIRMVRAERAVVA